MSRTGWASPPSPPLSSASALRSPAPSGGSGLDETEETKDGHITALEAEKGDACSGGPLQNECLTDLGSLRTFLCRWIESESVLHGQYGCSLLPKYRYLWLK